jgi:hypothetical protein
MYLGVKEMKEEKRRNNAINFAVKKGWLKGIQLERKC